MKRTRAIELLDQMTVPYEVRTFESEGFASAVEVAEKLGLPAGSVFKTLVVRGDRTGVVMAVIPGDRTLSLRKLAELMGDKRAEMVEEEELFRLTGSVKGGISPIGGRRAFPVYLDESVNDYDRVCVSAGRRGVQLLLKPEDLGRLTSATLGDLIE